MFLYYVSQVWELRRIYKCENSRKKSENEVENLNDVWNMNMVDFWRFNSFGQYTQRTNMYVLTTYCNFEMVAVDQAF